MEQLLIGQSGTERVPWILVLEQQANLIQVQMLRLNTFLSTEQKMQGLPYSAPYEDLKLKSR